MSETDRDMDETRRLLLCAYFVGRVERYELAGTIANALLYHPQRTAFTNSRDEVFTQLTVLCDAFASDASSEEREDAEAWALLNIDSITAALGRKSPTLRPPGDEYLPQERRQ